MSRLTVIVLLVLVKWCAPSGLSAGEDAAAWPQFRGPNATGVCANDRPLPVDFGPDKNVAWKTPVPSGHSSPCLWHDRIFLTAFDADAKRIEVLALDRRDGRILWRQPVATERLEHVHQLGSPATATPAADPERVYCYFGSFGLICFDHDGREQWKAPLPVPRRMFGSGTSPVVAGELVLLSRDDQPDPHLWAFDRRTGAVVWKQKLESKGPFGPPQDGYSTPVVHGDEVLLHRASEFAAYALADGARRWWVRVNSNGCTTPVLGDGMVYVATWNNFGEPDLRVE
ncbi:MAG TPA: PQQ-binding-like beta-propeller repeat protein, partial [Planctomycetaceae bacterium]|nr:PQQ-binding-like beta-propeller repeat protein [Planctomycetaceae bacterium]